MRIAIIDLGTNTFNLLIAEINTDNNYDILLVEELPVKLGQGGLNKKIITPEAFQRGLDGLKKHLETIKAYGVETVKAFATSGIRSTENGKEFIDRAYKETGFQVKVISGEEEAQLIYKGVKFAGLLADKPSLVMDIGGGSTEFIIADESQILWKRSFELGVSRLIQKFNPSDPLTTDQIASICNYFDEILFPLYTAWKQYPVSRLIGSSGSFESFASIITGMQPPCENADDGSVSINLNNFKELFEVLIHSTETQRMQIKGLVVSRVDTIVYAVVFVQYILDKFKISELMLSHFALKEGALFDMIHKG